jgi:cytochrome c
MWNRMQRSAFAAVLAIGMSAAGLAIGATSDEAKSLAEKAAARVKEVGETEAFKEFQNKDGAYIKGELYVFCNALDGTVLSHGGNPALVGKNVLHMKDPDGKEPLNEMNNLAIANGSGWYEYKWPNPVSKKIETKAAYFVKVNNEVCGVGYYKE